MSTTTADPDCNDDRRKDVPVSSSEANEQGTESRAESSATPEQLGASHGPVEHLQGAELEHLQKKHVEACAALEKALGRLNADEDEVSTLRQQLDLMREQISTDIESAASIIRQQQRASRVRTPTQPSSSPAPLLTVSSSPSALSSQSYHSPVRMQSATARRRSAGLLSAYRSPESAASSTHSSTSTSPSRKGLSPRSKAPQIRGPETLGRSPVSPQWSPHMRRRSYESALRHVAPPEAIARRRSAGSALYTSHQRVKESSRHTPPRQNYSARASRRPHSAGFSRSQRFFENDMEIDDGDANAHRDSSRGKRGYQHRVDGDEHSYKFSESHRSERRISPSQENARYENHESRSKYKSVNRDQPIREGGGRHVARHDEERNWSSRSEQRPGRSFEQDRSLAAQSRRSDHKHDAYAGYDYEDDNRARSGSRRGERVEYSGAVDDDEEGELMDEEELRDGGCFQGNDFDDDALAYDNPEGTRESELRRALRSLHDELQWVDENAIQARIESERRLMNLVEALAGRVASLESEKRDLQTKYHEAQAALQPDVEQRLYALEDAAASIQNETPRLADTLDIVQQEIVHVRISLEEARAKQNTFQEKKQHRHQDQHQDQQRYERGEQMDVLAPTSAEMDVFERLAKERAEMVREECSADLRRAMHELDVGRKIDNASLDNRLRDALARLDLLEQRITDDHEQSVQMLELLLQEKRPRGAASAASSTTSSTQSHSQSQAQTQTRQRRRSSGAR